MSVMYGFNACSFEYKYDFNLELNMQLCMFQLGGV